MYTTEFITAENQVKHTFENGIEVLADFSFHIAHVSFNNKKTNSFSIEDMSLGEYHLILKKYGEN
jgi:hypothetical protein